VKASIVEGDISDDAALYSLPTNIRKVRARATTVSSCDIMVICSPLR